MKCRSPRIQSPSCLDLIPVISVAVPPCVTYELMPELAQRVLLRQAPMSLPAASVKRALAAATSTVISTETDGKLVRACTANGRVVVLSVAAFDLELVPRVEGCSA